MNSGLATRNRHALILLDSALEVSFKEFLLYVVGIKDLDAAHVEHREVLHKIVKRHTKFEKPVWDSIEFFYERRCNLYHEDASSTLTDDSLLDFFLLVIWIVDRLFGSEIERDIRNPEDLLEFTEAGQVDVNAAKSKIDAVIIAIGRQKLGGSGEIAEQLKRLGYRGGMTAGKISSLMANYSYKHLFHLEKTGQVGLSQAGMKRYIQVLADMGGS